MARAQFCGSQAPVSVGNFLTTILDDRYKLRNNRQIDVTASTCSLPATVAFFFIRPTNLNNLITMGVIVKFHASESRDSSIS